MTAAVHPSISAPPFPRGAAIAGLVWLVLATIAGLTGILTQRPFIILGLTAVALIAALGRTSLAAWLNAVPLRWLVGINVTRFVGIVFLLVAARGRLNPVFAARAGWGDIAVAATALVLAAVAAAPRGVLLAWNALGALDLVIAVGTATVVSNVSALLTFPLSLVPTFAVPLLLANHAVIFRRLLRDGR